MFFYTFCLTWAFYILNHMFCSFLLIFVGCYCTIRLMSEKNVKDKIKKILAAYHIYYFMPPAAVYGKRGTGDFICCINGRFLAIETKDVGKEQTPLQKLAQRQICACAGDYLLIYPHNIHDVESYLKTYAVQK